MSGFPVEVSESVRCVSMVHSRLDPLVLEAFVTIPVSDSEASPKPPLSLNSFLPSLDTDTHSSGIVDDVEVGNPHTLQDPIYSAKDRAKLAALPHVRRFLTEGFVPADAKVAHWVKWLAREMKLDNGIIWKVDKSRTLKL